MDYLQAVEVLQEVKCDYDLKGGRCTGFAPMVSEALLVFAEQLIEAFDTAADVASQQADWEFQNNPGQPGARLACEKLEKAFTLMAERQRKELFLAPEPNKPAPSGGK